MVSASMLATMSPSVATHPARRAYTKPFKFSRTTVTFLNFKASSRVRSVLALSTTTTSNKVREVRLPSRRVRSISLKTEARHCPISFSSLWAGITKLIFIPISLKKNRKPAAPCGSDRLFSLALLEQGNDEGYEQESADESELENLTPQDNPVDLGRLLRVDCRGKNCTIDHCVHLFVLDWVSLALCFDIPPAHIVSNGPNRKEDYDCGDYELDSYEHPTRTVPHGDAEEVSQHHESAELEHGHRQGVEVEFPEWNSCHTCRNEEPS